MRTAQEEEGGPAVVPLGHARLPALAHFPPSLEQPTLICLGDSENLMKAMESLPRKRHRHVKLCIHFPKIYKMF